MRILLAEDDAMIGSSIQDGLQDDGYSVDWVCDGTAALAALQHEIHQLLLLDIGLPKMDGVSLLKQIRRDNIDLPVLIITARDSLRDKVQGLDLGADDYLVKPFDLNELSARIRAVMRRRQGRASEILEVGRIKMNTVTHDVWLEGGRVNLSKREFSLLKTLMEEPRKPFSRAQLEELLYSWGNEVDSNAVEVHIHALRRKLGSDAVRNLRGVGYYVRDDM